MILVAAAVVVRDGRVLLSQRPAGKHLAGLWEFPGGKVEPNEDPVAALDRELREELGVATVEPEPLTFVHHAYPERTVLLLFYRCGIDGEPRALEGNPVAWVPLEELDRYPLPAADRPVLELIRDSAGALAAGPRTH